jgi:hypothetical protein
LNVRALQQHEAQGEQTAEATKDLLPTGRRKQHMITLDLSGYRAAQSRRRPASIASKVARVRKRKLSTHRRGKVRKQWPPGFGCANQSSNMRPRVQGLDAVDDHRVHEAVERAARAHSDKVELSHARVPTHEANVRDAQPRHAQVRVDCADLERLERPEKKEKRRRGMCFGGCRGMTTTQIRGGRGGATQQALLVCEAVRLGRDGARLAQTGSGTVLQCRAWHAYWNPLGTRLL